MQHHHSRGATDPDRVPGSVASVGKADTQSNAVDVTAAHARRVLGRYVDEYVIVLCVGSRVLHRTTRSPEESRRLVTAYPQAAGFVNRLRG